VLLAATAVLSAGWGLVPPTLAQAAPDAPAAGQQQSLPEVALPGLDAGTHPITLVTGDKLRLTATGSGLFSVSVEHMAPRPDQRRAATIQVTSKGGSGDGSGGGSGDSSVYAVPSDVRAAVETGRVDRRLFDLAYLAEHDLLDADSAKLPLILRYGGKSGFAKAKALPASDATLALESIQGAAVTVPKATAADFWTAVHATPDSATLTGDLRSVWLDATAEPTLDVSVPLIGAPQAWASGLDGSGSTVAVLDTGADLGHPDLAGQIAVTKSFIDGETVQDQHGHGTHVATTIAGTGAASGGRYKGVAPGAKLAIGKVCAIDGCPNSSTIEGMEWAVAQGADVVSLSLGGGATDGTDPMSVAVNELTAGSGALFVIAAGNSGPSNGTVETPGTADAALTVAASTKTDTLAEFSSRGPRLDGALKPDIAAPGVGIVAGRAAGTTMGTPVDDHYTSANGTSMATPHVSGAAAILAQRHPDWAAGALKAALMSTSKDIGSSVYERGAGRVDVAKAVAQSVVATTTSVDFGAVDPGQVSDPIDKEITYTNDGDTPVTLTLSRTLAKVGGDAVPGGVFTGAEEITVPAHGSATTTVTLDHTELGIASYTGAVTATAGTVSLTTPVAVDRQPPRSELIVHLLDDTGAHACGMCGWVQLVAVDVPGAGMVPMTMIEEGVFRAWVKPGTYSVHGDVRWLDPKTSEYSTAYMIDPQLEVDHATETTLDPRKAKEVTMRTPKDTQSIGHTVTWSRGTADSGLMTSVTIGGYAFGQEHVLVTPTEKVTDGEFRFGVGRTLANRQITMRVAGRDGFDLRLHHRAYADHGMAFAPEDWTPWDATRGRMELVDVGYGKPEDLAGKNLRGKLAVLRWGDDRYGPDDTGPDGVPDSMIWYDRLQALKDAGAAGYIAVSAPPPGWEHHFSFGVPSSFVSPTPDHPESVALPEVQVSRDHGLELVRRLARDRVWVDLNVDPNVRYTYHLYPTHVGQVPDRVDHQFTDRQLAVVDASYHGAKPDYTEGYFSVFSPGQNFGGGTGIASAAGTQRTEYWGPVNDQTLVMRTNDTSASEYSTWVNLTTFDRRERSTERWFVPVTAPGAMKVEQISKIVDPAGKVSHTFCIMCREGDELFWPILNDAYGEGEVINGPAVIGGVRLYAGNGKEIPVSNQNGLPVFRLPAGKDTYRMTQDANGKRTTWQFSSAAPTKDTWTPNSACLLRLIAGGTDLCSPQPLIYLGYDLGSDLRLDNTVRAGNRHEFTVSAYHAESTGRMPAISGLRVWTSTDDGATWRPATVGRGKNGQYSVRADYPSLSRTKGAVSIKAQAWDANGNRIEQVLDRAFPLAAR
jgi:subtilisin family serine protease